MWWKFLELKHSLFAARCEESSLLQNIMKRKENSTCSMSNFGDLFNTLNSLKSKSTSFLFISKVIAMKQTRKEYRIVHYEMNASAINQCWTALITSQTLASQPHMRERIAFIRQDWPQCFTMDYFFTNYPIQEQYIHIYIYTRWSHRLCPVSTSTIQKS